MSGGKERGNRVLVKKYREQQRKNNMIVHICKAMGMCCNDMNGKKCMCGKGDMGIIYRLGYH